MRKLKFVITFLLAMIMTISVMAGCGGGSKPTGNSADFGPQAPTANNVIKGKYSSVWTMPSTAKIKRDDEIPEKVDSELSLYVSGGEAESAQIIITAEDGVEITSYSVKTNNLTSGENVIPAENVEIYIEKYIKTTYKTNTVHSNGWYPDAIVPYDLVKNANELKFNEDAKADNQGIWVTINVPRGQEPGNYKGNINLTVEEENFTVPVSVKVFDFDINENIHAKTAFAIFTDRQMLEYGYNLPSGDSRKAEVYKNEYEFLASKKIGATNLPYSEFKDGDPVSFAKTVKKYASRPEIPSYRIAVDAPNRVLSASQLARFIEEIIKASIEENVVTYDLLGKAYCYFHEIDEPDPSTGGPDIFSKVKGVNDAFLQAKSIVMGKINSTYKDVEGIDKIKQSLNDLPHVVTSIRKKELIGKVQTFCPMVDAYQNPEYFDITEARKLSHNEGAWWYTCLKPVAPFPTYHVDDSMIGARAMGWMQKDYNIEGNLYWCTNIYRKYNGSVYKDRDIWNDPLAFPGANGDGYLTYPGTRYGLNGPIGTIRLDAVRDAQEDYEYLYMLEELINKANQENGTNIKFESVVSDLYDSIYSGVIAREDYYAILQARYKVGVMIEALVKDNAIISVIPYSADEEMYKIEVSAPVESTVKVNGKDAKSENGLFVIKTSDVNLKVAIGENEYKLSLVNSFKVSSFENTDNVTSDGITTTKETDVYMDGIASLKASVDTINKECELNVKFNTLNLADAKSVVLYIYNGSDEVLRPEISLIDAEGKTNKHSVVGYLYPEKWNKVEIVITNSKRMDLTKVNGLRLKIETSIKGSTMYLDNMFYTL